MLSSRRGFDSHPAGQGAGEGARGRSKAVLPWDAPVPARCPAELSAGRCPSLLPARSGGVSVGPPNVSLAGSPGPIYFWINSQYSADVSGQDLKV